MAQARDSHPKNIDPLFLNHSFLAKSHSSWYTGLISRDRIHLALSGRVPGPCSSIFF